ncbi:hypothetical protein BV20DRAFT_975195, partial [Pilatotrama ljubarskyi]
MSPLSQLPLEIIYHIIGLLEDDVSTLQHCALSNKAMLSCARANLYRNIRFIGYAYRQLQLLSRTLQAEHTLGSLVRSLRISGVSPFGDRGIYTDFFLTPDVLPFHLLSQLRELNLHGMQFCHIDDLVAIVGALPALERLVCDALIDDMLPLLPLEQVGQRIFQRSNGLEQPWPDPAQLPRLKELVIKNGQHRWEHWTLSKRLLMVHPVALQGLQLIDVSVGCVAEAAAWVPVIRAASLRLHSLSITMADRYYRHAEPLLPPDILRQYSSDHAYIVDNVAHCSALRFLRLKSRPDLFAPPEAPQPPSFLEPLCEAFEGRPPLFPAFEHLELWMVDREGRTVSVTDELAARLASSLLDSQRYPHFRRLSVRIRPQSWLADLQIQRCADPGRTPVRPFSD